jgi:hypothetical protein
MDTPHQSNSQPVIDSGGLLISRDNGSGTPKCAIWQGARTAYQEFKTNFGVLPPPADYSIVMWKGSIPEVPYSTLATTNWPDNYPTGSSGCTLHHDASAPIDFADPMEAECLFQIFQTSIHEFGHTIRHSLDGDQAHFLYDVQKYQYVHSHNDCDANNDGFAFNEGWAEYWSRNTAVCAGRETNTTVERTVAHDLELLAQCPVASVPEQRRNMVGVLWRGQNIIHSDADFRREYSLQFPHCVAGAFGSGAPAVFVPRLVTNRESRLRALEAAIDAQRQITSGLKMDLEVAERVATDAGTCPPTSCEIVAQRLVAPAMLRGSIELSEARSQRLAALLSAADGGNEAFLHPDQERLAAAAKFDQTNKEIAKRRFRERQRRSISVAQKTTPI